MIDPHLHLRDWAQAEKETVRHGLGVAQRAGLDAVFEMPNTDPPLTSRRTIEGRLALADAAGRGRAGCIVHGLYAGLTSDAEQVREAVGAHRALFPRVVGLKLYAGHSTGNMGIVTEEEQRALYRRLVKLRYRGVLAVHAEKEARMSAWDPERPASHGLARPPEAEVSSVEDQIGFAAEEGFQGVLHIAHVSVPETLGLVRAARLRRVPFRVTCGITPHHALLAMEDMNGPDGLLLKMNPPLRPRAMQEAMLQALMAGEIDWIETDHAPHTMRDKTEGYASGIPVLPFYPMFLAWLRRRGMSEAGLEALTHGNIERVFGFSVPRGQGRPELDLAAEYPFDPFEGWRRRNVLDTKAPDRSPLTGPRAPEPKLSIIVATDSAGLIGQGGKLPWRVPEDLRHFRRTTLGHPVIMGRRTFDSLAVPLDGRRLIVMTRRTELRVPEGVRVAHTVEEAIAIAGGEDAFVAGGAEIYAAFLPLASRLLVTLVPGEHAGDTYFPQVRWEEWRLVGERPGESPPPTLLTFRCYERASPGARGGSP